MPRVTDAGLTATFGPITLIGAATAAARATCVVLAAIAAITTHLCAIDTGTSTIAIVRRIEGQARGITASGLAQLTRRRVRPRRIRAA